MRRMCTGTVFALLKEQKYKAKKERAPVQGRGAQERAPVQARSKHLALGVRVSGSPDRILPSSKFASPISFITCETGMI